MIFREDDNGTRTIAFESELGEGEIKVSRVSRFEDLLADPHGDLYVLIREDQVSDGQPLPELGVGNDYSEIVKIRSRTASIVQRVYRLENLKSLLTQGVWTMTVASGSVWESDD
jgi:hypothetical protein